MSSTAITAGTTYRWYDNFSKTYRRFTVQSVNANGYASIVTDEGVAKMQPVAAIRNAEAV